MPPQLATTPELAELLDVRPVDILEWVRDGHIPAIKVGRAYYYSVGAVIRAIRERQADTAESREPAAVGSP